mgnify:CR=1 FL=1
MLIIIIFIFHLTTYEGLWEILFLLLYKAENSCSNTADKIIEPPINAKVDGLSLTNKKAQIGPKTDSDNIIIPTIAEGVVLAPIVININPKPT